MIVYWPESVGHGRADFFDERRAGGLDGHARQHGTGRIPNRAGNGTQHLGVAGQGHQQRGERQEQTETPRWGHRALLHIGVLTFRS